MGREWFANGSQMVRNWFANGSGVVRVWVDGPTPELPRMRKAGRMAGVCVLCLPLVGVAAPAPGAIEIETTLAGCWTGVLQYRDYQSDRLFDIPLSTKIRAIADGHTFVRESRFDDGPRRQVYITALTQFRPKVIVLPSHPRDSGSRSR